MFLVLASQICSPSCLSHDLVVLWSLVELEEHLAWSSNMSGNSVMHEAFRTKRDGKNAPSKLLRVIGMAH